MGPFGALVVFTIVWWCAFFALLPIGVRPVENAPPEHFAGAPDRQRLWLKGLGATIVATVLTALAWAALTYGWVDLYETFGEP